MKKVGIITLNGYKNYGNRLQNYATQEIMKELGFDAETLVYDPKPDILHENSSKASKVSRLRKMSFPKIYKRLYNKLETSITHSLYKERMESRTNIFKEFTKKHISETNFTISETKIPNDIADRYEYFLTGSDQVWNPYNTYGRKIYFLDFVPKEKRIAISPSFGVSEIPESQKKDFSKWLKEMHAISVREEAGAKIIKELTGRESPVLIDPTLMLSKEKWLSISKASPYKPDKQYLLTYFLGKVSKESKKYIKLLANRNQLEIINLAQIKEKGAYLSGPSEFIDYINSASVLLTDSFHGAVFSILLNTPLIVFERDNGKGTPSMNSRLDTLLTTFQLESRYRVNIKNDEDVFKVDYSHTEPILERNKLEMLNYLKKSVNGVVE